jgi:hypothetical protein
LTNDIDPQFSRLYGFPEELVWEISMTGQFVFRRSSQVLPKTPYESGKILSMVYGIVALPQKTMIQDHFTYPVIGHFKDGQLITTISLNEGEDHHKLLNGEGASGVFRAPIWRV